MDFSELLLADLERIFRNDTTWTRRDLLALHRRICDLCCTALIETRRSQKAGRKVYLALKNFLTIRLKSIVEELESINDEQELLCEYNRCWKSYQASVTVLDIGCSYLNENWLKREILEDRDDVYTIYRLGMILWKSILFTPIDRSLINAINHTMVGEIHDQPINRSKIYTALQSIVDILGNDVNQSCSVLEKMTNVFQSNVIQFFESESKTLFRSLLESDLRGELQLFVKCAIIYKPAIEPDLCNTLSAHLECLLKNSIDRCGKLNYERDYVQAIWGLRKVPLLRAFADRKELIAKVDYVCDEVINKKPEGKKEGNTPLIFARYCHMLMLNKPSSENEEITLRNEMKKIVDVVLYLSEENRKSFTNDYFALLKKRCIDDTSASDKNESLLISMLAKDLGSDFQVKGRIERNEMNASNGIQAKCQEFLVGIGLKVQIDFRVKFFKVRQLEGSINGIRLPVELEQFENEFRLFWSKEFNRYGLNFHPLKSWGELTMNSSSQKCYTLRVNTLQMALLLQFNHQNTFAVQKLAENVGTSAETLIQVMCPLIDHKLLIASENSAPLTPTSSITVCRDYNRKRSLINCLKSIAPMGQKPTTERNMNIQELDTTIVRIMERKKQLQLKRLIHEVTLEPKHHSSSIFIIDARIKHFLKNKYLELSSDEKVIKLSKI
ncbi:cullin homolog 1 isoform X2 [Drosophila miranda]|uniref:cullin homolog 1 isoform X2 n=1 Tax=Drosophila miranda TaxID=7229 RepID=UPI00143F4469|nr:cullin homolog 1 isoform X2 [Drosophila miranda]